MARLTLISLLRHQIRTARLRSSWKARRRENFLPLWFCLKRISISDGAAAGRPEEKRASLRFRPRGLVPAKSIGCAMLP